MATVKEINHDSSTTLSDFYTITITDTDGAVTVTIPSALNGSTNGVEMDYDAGSSLAVLEEDFTTLTGSDFRWRFWLDFSNMSFTGPLTSFVNLYLKSGATNIFRLQITLGFIPTTLRLIPIYYNDSGNPISGLPNFDSPQSNEFCVEIRAIRETADGNADGELELFTSGVSAGAISNVENFNRFNLGIDRARIEFLSSDSAAKGILYYDEWILDNDNTANLGCPQLLFSGYDLVLGGGQS